MTDDFPGVDFGDAYARAAAYAVRRARQFGLRLDAGQGKEIAGDALRQILEAGWNRDKYPEFFDCVASRVNGLVQNRSRKKGTRAEIPAELVKGTSDDSCRSPEEVVSAREMASVACGRILDRLDGNESAVAVFMAMADGVDKPADIATATGLATGVVYRARERISVVMSEVADELREEVGA